MGFEQMTPVQASTVPLFMRHKDVVVEVRSTCLSLPLEMAERRVQGGYGFWENAGFRVAHNRETPSPRTALTKERGWSLDCLSYAVCLARPAEASCGRLMYFYPRELATQIHSVLELIIGFPPSLKNEGGDQGEGEDEDEDSAPREPPARVLPPPLLLVSGSDSSPQEDVARFLSQGSPIVVGTPGRIEEFLLKTGLTKVSVKELEMLVLDEADRCGF